jgi:predicted O-methyltransferase YrrM
VAIASAVSSLKQLVNPTASLPGGFSLSPALIQDIFQNAKPLGHHEDPQNLNLGFGFLYYSLVRTLRPEHVVVIGSGFGFSVACLALGLRDNARGRLSFVDPSYSLLGDGPFKTVGGTSQWSDPAEVTRRFGRFGVADRVTHYRMTSAEFFVRYAELELGTIDLAFIDGNHSFDSVRQDFTSALRRMRKNGYLLLHDTNIYIREFVRHAGVKRWLRQIQRRRDCFEAVDFPFASGVALVRVLEDKAWMHLDPSSTR